MEECLITSPILSKAINNKINEIANCLLNYSDPNIYLMGGKAGVALFWAYYSEYSKSADYSKKMAQIISEIFEEIKHVNIYPSFSGGIAGIGWITEHLIQNGFIENDSDSLSNLDDFLYPHMLEYINRGDYDYLHGALGIGLYYLNRPSNSKIDSYISELVYALEKQGTYFSGSIAWETKLSFASNDRGYNLSLSHGMASIISLLVRFYKRNILRDKISVLVKGAINYLLQNKQDPIFYKYFFPGGITKDGNQKSGLGRLSWCYNDLGISIVLLQAGNAFNNEIWKGEAIQSLLHTSKITDWKEAGVMDAGLCHGTSGIAHLYNRAYTYTGIEIFKSSSIYWFEQSLKIATFENGLAGYKTYRTEKYGGMENNYSFLEGIAGIGLALISSVSQVDPTWDNALLIS